MHEYLYKSLNIHDSYLMYTYQINNLTEDFEKKLSLYSNQIFLSHENYCFNHERYEKFVNIIINPHNLDIQSMINRLESYYKSGIYYENGKLNFGHSDINMIASKLYKELWNQDNSNTLETYINIIENRIDGDLSRWFEIYFDDEVIKNNFLDAATNYIIAHQNTEWIEAFAKIYDQKYPDLLPSQISEIPEKFDNFSDLYFSIKSTGLAFSLHFIGNPTVKSLLHNVIAIENYNPLYIHVI